MFRFVIPLSVLCVLASAAYANQGDSRQTLPSSQQVISLSSSPSTLTVPGGTSEIDIFPLGTNGSSGNCLFYQDDGGTPSQTQGSGLASEQNYIGFKGSLNNLKFILASGATCTVTVNYYQGS